MEPPAQPPPPTLATATTITSPSVAPPPAIHLNYPDSVDSSPRSRATDSWDASAPAAAATAAGDPLPPKLRLMCSYGGHIVPRPHDKSLCYVGGDTRIVVVDRQVTNLSSLSAHLSKTLLNNRPFTLKYQLPNEDLDSLITVSSDEDLDNMIEEYDRTMLNSGSAAKPSRLRLFLFPTKPESSQSIGPILESSTKSEDWFLNALNNAGVLNRGYSDSSPGNCLLNLDDDVGVGNIETSSRDADGSSSLGNEKGAKHAQDVHSVPDSPMLETTSSFGSTSSSPSIANLPPIRVQVEEGSGVGGGGGPRVLQDQKLGIEEQFAQMMMGTGVSQKLDEGFVLMSSPPPPPVPAAIAVAGVPVSSAVVAPSVDYLNMVSRAVSDDERSDHGAPLGFRKLAPSQPQQQPQSQQKPSGGLVDLPSPDSVSSDGNFTNVVARPKPIIFQDSAIQMPPGVNRTPTSAVDPNINVSEQNSGVQLQQPIQDARYVLQTQVDQRQTQQHQQHQQFVHGGPHYVQHHPQGSVPVTAYYTVYPPQQQHVQHHQLDQHYPVYYMPMSQPQGYNIANQQPNPSENASTNPSSRSQAAPSPAMVPQSAAYSNPVRNPSGVKTDIATGVYRMVGSAAPSPLVQVTPNQHQQQYVGYSQIHHPSQSVAPPSGAAAAYGYEFANPATGQVYYTQHLAAPSLSSQYQTMTAANAVLLPEASSQLSADNVKPQMRTSQPL